MGYAFDTIGNRTQATRGSETSSYLLNSNGLNQYAQRTIPALHDIVGSADTAADVRVNQILATRQGTTFSRQIAVDNSSAPVWKPIDIVASLSTGEVVKETGNLFVPKTPEPFTHDADGNLTDDGRWTYTWDAENRLIAQEIKSPAATAGAPHQRLEYGYDGGSRRIFKKVYTWNGSSFAIVSSKLYVYSGWNMLAELNALSSNTPIRTFVWGSDLSGSSEGAGGVGGLLAIATNGNTFAPTYDGNGNVTALVNVSNGLQQASYAYGPFGELTTKHGVSANDNPFQFSTKYTDLETDLVYYGFRYYNSSTGRWLSRDPIDEAGGVNLYGIIDNDPVNSLDIWGLAAAKPEMGKNLDPRKCKDPCEELLENLIKQAKHLRWRYIEMLLDRNSLWEIRFGGSTKDWLRNSPTTPELNSKGTWTGHRNQYYVQKRRLKDMIQDYDDEDCGDRIPVWIRVFADKEAPDRPIRYEMSKFYRSIGEVPEESIPTMGEAFLYGAGGAAVVVTGGGALGLVSITVGGGATTSAAVGGGFLLIKAASH